MSLEPGSYKRFMYYQNVANRTYADANLLIKDDGVIHYSYTTYKMKRSKDGYYRSNAKRQGFTLDEKGKLKIWFGGTVQGIPHLTDVLKALNKEWFTLGLMGILTKGLLEKVLNSKITNPTDYAKAYIKVMRINCSPKLLLNAVTQHNIVSSYIYRGAQLAKDLNHFLEYMIRYKQQDLYSNENFNHIQDLERQAMILGKKIDYMWSDKRMQEEHNNWTKEIMELEMNSISDVTLNWLQEFHQYMPEGFTLLDTQKKVFAEGKSMHHCVYTNYWSSIKAGRYIAIHIDTGSETATLGLNVENGKLGYNQMYGTYNRSVSSSLHIRVRMWLNSIENTVPPALLMQRELIDLVPLDF